MLRFRIIYKGLVSALVALALPFVVSAASASSGSVTGTVKEAGSGEPLVGVVMKLDDGAVWAVTDIDGNYSFSGLSDGKYIVEAECLGYVTVSKEVEVKGAEIRLDFEMAVSSLALDEVVVTAQKSKLGINTSHTLGRDALNHLQVSNITDVAALLPGGKTVNPDLTADNQLSLRDGGATAGNAAFGAALEVDGVRVGNNASLGAMSGVSTRSVAVDNIESVEVITGVPSAEYGDLNSGMVKINTRRGRTPMNVTFSVNPRTYQASLSKGIDLQDDRGVLNLSGEWARATSKLTSPYTSYTRREISAHYSNTFRKSLRFEAGVTGNLGGMNSEDDPDAFSGEYQKVHDNVLRANTSIDWLVNNNFITSLRLEASANYNDNLSHTHVFNSQAASLPAVHSEIEGYWLADQLPLTYHSDQIIDSRELDFAASLKYTLNRRWDDLKNKVKAGVQWKANGNVGEGEYYQDPSLAADGYRPRPYSQYPFMHNLSVYAEDDITIPMGRTSLQVTAGLRMENVFIQGSQYNNTRTFSPRFNAKWMIGDKLAFRAGWGVSEKLPSFFILYPKQEYRDIQTFGFSYGDAQSSYLYYTQPYTLEHNPDLKWQRSNNTEVAIEAEVLSTKISIVGFRNITQNPYKYSNLYTPFTYTILQMPADFKPSADVQLKTDSQTGAAYLRNSDDDYWTPAEVKVVNSTFVKSSIQDNGAPVYRSGVELTADFPEIRPIRTSLRLDASYSNTHFADSGLSYYYQAGSSHTTLPNRSYQYVGVYPNGGNSSYVVNGRKTSSVDANLTAITHIPEARLIVSLRLEASLLKRSRNISDVDGAPYAFTITSASDKTPTGKDIYAGDSYVAVYPVSYLDLDGVLHPFTAADVSNPDLSKLVLQSGNAYLFAQDGYGPYFSANLSITKEIGDHVSISFFANNFTNSRKSVTSMATGVDSIFTPAFYYGLTCRLKL